MRREPLKRIALDGLPELSLASLQAALFLAKAEPHDGWADLIVNPSQLKPAVKLMMDHNATTPPIKVRVLSEKRFGQVQWALRTRSVEIV